VCTSPIATRVDRTPPVLSWPSNNYYRANNNQLFNVTDSKSGFSSATRKT
jgi:hypothetical protein